MSLYQEQSKNIRKTWILVLVFLVIIIGIGWLLSYVYNSQAILYIAIAIAFVQTAISYWSSDKIALASTGAKKVTREQHFELWNAVENISITAGIPMPKVYIINEQAPNAFATGRDPEHAAVAVTTGLLALLEKKELEGVIAHELSHIKNRDILVSSVIVVLVGTLVLISDIFLRSRLLGGRDNREGGNMLAIVGIVILIVSPFLGMLIQMAVSRKREFLADSSGALLTRYPEGLASALEKISSRSQKMKKASNATAHLFIVNSFGARKKEIKGIAKLFATHPPVSERIARLRGV